jgi:prepilin-type N-terminal cleavage/methylation domain-containing protein
MLKRTTAFTLLEVMVAMAILAMTVTTLVIIRNEALKDAARAIELRKLRILSEQKMGEFVTGVERNTGGTFHKEGYSEYAWSVHRSYTNIKSSASDAQGKIHEVSLQKITLVVRNQQNPQYTQSLETYLLVKRPEDASEEKENR